MGAPIPFPKHVLQLQVMLAGSFPPWVWRRKFSMTASFKFLGFFFLKGRFCSVKNALLKRKLKQTHKQKKKKYKTVETKENIDF